MTTLTRRYHFSASHRLNCPEYSPAENSRLFGKCNHPFGHGHNYTLEVTLTGTVDAKTGLLVPLAHLDQLVQDRVLQLLAYRNINTDVPQFADRVPTSENLALVISGLLQEHWSSYIPGSTAHLWRVQIQETDRNGFEIIVGARPTSSAPQAQWEPELVSQ